MSVVSDRVGGSPIVFIVVDDLLDFHHDVIVILEVILDVVLEIIIEIVLEIVLVDLPVVVGLLTAGFARNSALGSFSLAAFAIVSPFVAGPDVVVVAGW